ncbi:hypothetical protein AAMO2058_001180600 [Amorphochlora amoebiformis]
MVSSPYTIGDIICVPFLFTCCLPCTLFWKSKLNRIIQDLNDPDKRNLDFLLESNPADIGVMTTLYKEKGIHGVFVEEGERDKFGIDRQENRWAQTVMLSGRPMPGSGF